MAFLPNKALLASAVLGLTLTLSQNCFAQSVNTTNTIPNCTNQDFRFQGNNIYFNSKAPAPVQNIFVIQNKANYSVALNRAETNTQADGASAGWGTQLGVGKASALTLNKANFPMTCSNSTNQRVFVNCKQVISVCRYAPQPNIKNGYWLAENIDPSQIPAAIQQRNAQAQQ